MPKPTARRADAVVPGRGEFASASQPPLVGREVEVGGLEEMLFASGGPGRAVLVYGEAGIGKSALAAEIARRSARHDIPLVWATSYEGEPSPPLAPWTAALRRYLEILPVVRREELLGVDAERLDSVLGGQGRAAGEPSTLEDAIETRGRVFETVASFLDRLGRRSLVVFDDVQWADPDSLELLVYVARFTTHPALLLLRRAARLDGPPELARRLAEVERARGCTYTRLDPLPRDAGAELIGAVAGTPIDTETIDELYQRSAGNPFFLTELARALDDPLARASGELPVSIRGAIALRIDALSPWTESILELAAMFTETFAAETIALAANLDASSLDRLLEEAEAADLLRTLPGDRYEFSHALVRHAIYDRLRPLKRAHLHRRIVRALEGLPDAERAAEAFELARQYHASAGLPGAERGVDHAVAAAARARASAAPYLAVELLGMAIDLVPATSSRTRAELTGQLAVAQAEASMHREAAHSLERALEMLEQSGASTEEIADLGCSVGQALRVTFTYPSGPVIERTLRSLGKVDRVRWARLRRSIVPLERETSGPLRIVHMLHHDGEAVRILRAAGSESDYAITLWSNESWTDAEFREALERVRSMREPRSRLSGLLGVGAHVPVSLPDPSFVESLTEDLETVAQTLDARQALAVALAVRSITVGRAGRLRSAVDTAAKAHDLLERHPETPFTPSNVRLYGWLAEQHLKPDWDGIAAQAWDLATTRTPARYHVLSFASLAALAQARAHRACPARRALGYVLPLLYHSRAEEGPANCALGLAVEAIAVLGDRELAAQVQPIAQRLIAGGAGDYYMTHHDLTIGRLEAVLGDPEAAVQAFDRARVALDRAGERPLRAIVDFEEAVILGACGDARAGALSDFARLQFEELQMGVWGERLTAIVEGKSEGGPTRREREVLALLAQGLTNRQIAEQLVLSVHTVDRHLKNAYAKIGAHNRAEATAWVVRQER